MRRAEMKPTTHHIVRTLLFSLCYTNFAHCLQSASAYDQTCNVTYQGVSKLGVDYFFGIHYGEDTGGGRRFKPPIPYVPKHGSAVDATIAGPACPQPKGDSFTPLYISNVTEISEDCLHLNVYRPHGTKADAKLPVFVYIHGGSFYVGSKDDLVVQPEGLIRRSVDIGIPMIQININYRLGVFGFAQNEALKEARSENNGLRDQRLGIEWVRDNIAHFGGDPDRISIGGQSSGGLAVGMQIMAYAASRPVPFQQASCESQALEGGITGNFTRTSMERVVNKTGCNTTDLQSAATIECLRHLSMHELNAAQIKTWSDKPNDNIGDKWLPVVDGDFLPAAPSALIASGKFANVTTMIGWCEDDGNFFVGKPTSSADVYDFLRAYLPGFTDPNLHHLISLYPLSDFRPNPAAGLTAYLYQLGRIVRDILFVCQASHYGQAIAKQGNAVYLWDQNQTLLTPILDFIADPGYGVIHTSNFAFEFGNFSRYAVDDWPFDPNATDFALQRRQSSSWASFVNFGSPGKGGYGALEGWGPAFRGDGEVDVFVIGGPHEGLSAESGPGAEAAVAAQKLTERCAFLNSPEIIRQLDY